MLPNVFEDAGVRGTTQFCPLRKRMGLSFDVPGQSPWYFAITREHAVFLRLCLDDYLNSPAGAQSCKSDGIPSDPISVPSGGVNT